MALLVGRDDFNDIARGDLVVERHHTPAHLRADHPVANGRVDRIGKVDHRGPRGQADHVPLGRKDKHLVGRKVGFNRLDNLLKVVRLLLCL